jgi:hypothetical protein
MLTYAVMRLQHEDNVGQQRMDRISSQSSMESNASEEPGAGAPAELSPEEAARNAAKIAEAENLQQLKDTNNAIEAAAHEHATSALAEASGAHHSRISPSISLPCVVSEPC